MRPPPLALSLLLLIATPAMAEEREYCPDRPGMGTPACTIEPGRYSLEIGALDWSRESDDQSRQDIYTIADALVRRGIADHAELQIGWTALGIERDRDRGTGAVDHRSGTGDLTLSMRRNFANPDGSGLSLAAMPYVTIPVGGAPLGAGDWEAGVRGLASVEATDAIAFATTTEIEAAADEDGDGRHLAFREVLGVSDQLSDRLTLTAEYELTADHDPEGHSVQHRSGLSLAWLPSNGLQFDVGGNLGLDHDAPDGELYAGLARRF